MQTTAGMDLKRSVRLSRLSRIPTCPTLMVRTCWWERPEESTVAGGGIVTVSAMLFQGERSRVGAEVGSGCV